MGRPKSETRKDLERATENVSDPEELEHIIHESSANSTIRSAVRRLLKLPRGKGRGKSAEAQAVEDQLWEARSLPDVLKDPTTTVSSTTVYQQARKVTERGGKVIGYKTTRRGRPRK